MLSSERAMAGSYDFRLVALSVLISIFACYAALDLAGRVTSAQGRIRGLWLCGGATAMGTGIWAMHYIGMLAFRLPVPVEYDWPTVLASLLAAIFASAVALFVVSRDRMGLLQALAGSIFMGGAIAGMHYIGMAAMRLPAMCHYSVKIVTISIALAIVIAFVALWLAFHFRSETTSGGWRKALSALVMGAAVPVMHYTGMAAVTFVPSASVEGSLSHALNISALGETGVIAVTFMVLGLTIFTSLVDRRFSAQALELESSEKRSRQILETSFDAFVGMDSQGRITDWNAQAERAFGWSFAEVVGKILPEVIIPTAERETYRKNTQTSLDSTTKGALNRRFESMAFCRGGGEIPVEITMSAANQGDVHYSAAFLRDLSQRYKSEERFRGFMESSSEAIICVDSDGLIAIVNSQAEKLFGYSRSEMLQQKVEMLVPERMRHGHPGRRAGFSAAPKVRPMGAGIELWAVRKDGSEFPAEISLRPFAWDDKTLISTVILDITARKDREKALADANEKLRIVLEEAQQRSHEAAKLAELLDVLQSCQTAEEAYKVIQRSLPMTLLSRSGALCLTSASRNAVEVVAAWGENSATETSFHPDSCWALRRGKVQRSKNNSSTLICAHVTGAPPDGYLCVPLAAQGETLGVLYLECLPSLSEASRDATEALFELAMAVGERISLALANLKLREILRTQSVRDPLTGLFNRRYMEETLEREFKRAVRNKQPAAILMLDIDHFKQFNDTFGHQAGDTLLQTFGEFLSQRMRGEDVVCRYGGEEFTVILAGASLDVACRRAELLRTEVKQLTVQHARQVLGTISVSIGAAAYPGYDTANDLLHAADQALYRAKAEGRDRVVAEDN